MGGDGGTLAVKRAFLRGDDGAAERARQNAEKMAGAEARATALRACSLSGEPLRAPVVCCELGNLYNKEAVLQRVLEGPPLEDAFRHVKVKEMIDCVLTPNPAAADSQASSASSSTSDAAASSLTFWADPDRGPAPFLCPITQLEMNGKHPFVCLHPSGRVLSSKALAEVPEIREGERVIPLHPSQEERDRMLQDLLERRKQAKRDRKKRKKKQCAADGSESAAAEDAPKRTKTTAS